MVPLKKLEIKTTELFKQKNYSTVVFEITSQTKKKIDQLFCVICWV